MLRNWKPIGAMLGACLFGASTLLASPAMAYMGYNYAGWYKQYFPESRWLTIKTSIPGKNQLANGGSYTQYIYHYMFCYPGWPSVSRRITAGVRRETLSFAQNIHTTDVPFLQYTDANDDGYYYVYPSVYVPTGEELTFDFYSYLNGTWEWQVTSAGGTAWGYIYPGVNTTKYVGATVETTYQTPSRNSTSTSYAHGFYEAVYHQSSGNWGYWPSMSVEQTPADGYVTSYVNGSPSQVTGYAMIRLY